MGRRQELNELLKTITEYVYFEAPSNVQMQYPCIKYKRDGINTIHADNRPWRLRYLYQLTIIDRNPESPIIAAVAELPECSFSDSFVTENLHHDIFSIYF